MRNFLHENERRQEPLVTAAARKREKCHGQSCHAIAQRPEDPTEFLTLLARVLEPSIRTHQFVARLEGVELQDIDGFSLGQYRVIPASLEAIRTLGGDADSENAAAFLQHALREVWITAETRGTPRVAEVKFAAGARLATGLLAVVAGCRYQHGAHRVRITVALSAEDASGDARFLSWTDRERSPTLSFVSARGCPIQVDAALRTELETQWARAVQILESAHPTELEAAIVRAVYWYGEAHRETPLEMRLLKYWSCVETFFSASREHITQAVTVGAASVLAFGPRRFVAIEEYRSVKKRLEALYEKRSLATHEAHFGHIAEFEAADFSQWVAWMLVNVILFTEQGCQRCEDLKAWTQQQNTQYDPPPAGDPPNVDTG